MHCTVTATHLECVDIDHNKYYRTYQLTFSDKSTRLIRNWGRRGAPTGQWLQDDARRHIDVVAANICESKIWDKGYELVHTTSFELDLDADLFTNQFNAKHVPGPVADDLSAGFDQAWAADVVGNGNVDGPWNGSHVVLINSWDETVKARAGARAAAELVDGAVRYREPRSDRVAVVVGAGALDAMVKGFGELSGIAAARDSDDADTLMVALRLFNPLSAGPYRHFDAAVRDARRLFTRTKTAAP
jgi:predicted DNA-binding WGR domain protein